MVLILCVRSCNSSTHNRRAQGGLPSKTAVVVARDLLLPRANCSHPHALPLCHRPSAPVSYQLGCCCCWRRRRSASKTNAMLCRKLALVAALAATGAAIFNTFRLPYSSVAPGVGATAVTLKRPIRRASSPPPPRPLPRSLLAAREPADGGRQEGTVVGMGRVAWADAAGDRHFVGQRRCRATAAGGRARVWWSAIGSRGARGGG